MGPIHNALDVDRCDFDGFRNYFHNLLNRGIYIAPSQYEVGFISLAHNLDILDQTVSHIDTILKDVFVHA